MEKETYITRVYDFEELKDFCWSGAIQTLEAIEEKGKEEDFINLLNDILECNDIDGVKWTDTQLNDFIWFDTDYIEECLGCKLWEGDEE